MRTAGVLGDERRQLSVVVGELLVGVGGGEHDLLGVGWPGDLDADGQAVGESRRDAQAGDAGEVEHRRGARHHVDPRLLRIAEGGDEVVVAGRDRDRPGNDDHVGLVEGVLEVALHEMAGADGVEVVDGAVALRAGENLLELRVRVARSVDRCGVCSEAASAPMIVNSMAWRSSSAADGTGNSTMRRPPPPSPPPPPASRTRRRDGSRRRTSRSARRSEGRQIAPQPGGVVGHRGSARRRDRRRHGRR